ncbi:MAG: hypothetical protein KF699_04105 [Phycisphaeraceae bacterium]|nr:hypothetical protein [Phycisphaeraceae bacterium]MBX3405691.1 hypothetical protein [Phycisphaeraceae bacterium]
MNERVPQCATFAAALCAVLFAAAGCATEERVTSYRPFLTGVSGAQFGQQPVSGRAPTSASNADPGDGRIVIENPDGSRTLLCRTVRALMSHLERELDEGNTDVILKQLISRRTLEEFDRRGESPRAIVDFLQKHRRDIAVLFARMPMAERSPTIILQQPGDNVWILKLTGAAAEDTRFTRLWVVMERGSWKFYWVT